jgi:leader peptidase (prepilin peptidase)/N-methyltransferase
MAIALHDIVALGILAALASIAAFIDLKHLIIPDVINLAVLVSGVGASFLSTLVDPVSAISAIVVGAALVGAFQVGFRMYRGYDGLGRGDVKFIAAGGAWTGIEGLAVALIVSALTGLVYVLARSIADQSFDRTSRIAFAPALGFGIFVIVASQTLTGLPILQFLLVRFRILNVE